MKQKFRSFYSKILSACLALLGFSGCLVNTGCMYGDLATVYKVTGTVVSSEEEKKPIENIRVVMVHNVDENNASSQHGDTVFTDTKGKFEIKKFDGIYNKLKIKIQDIDGAENGLFEDVEQTIEFDSDYKNENNPWYGGDKTQKDLGTIEMKPKE